MIKGKYAFSENFIESSRQRKCDPMICGWKQKSTEDEKLNPDRPQERAPKKARQQERQKLTDIWRELAITGLACTKMERFRNQRSFLK